MRPVCTRYNLIIATTTTTTTTTHAHNRLTQFVVCLVRTPSSATTPRQWEKNSEASTWPDCTFLVIFYVQTLQFPSPRTCKHRETLQICIASRASHQTALAICFSSPFLSTTSTALGASRHPHLHTSLTAHYCHPHHCRRHLSPPLFVTTHSLQLQLAACLYVGHILQSTLEAPREGLRQGEVPGGGLKGSWATSAPKPNVAGDSAPPTGSFFLGSQSRTWDTHGRTKNRMERIIKHVTTTLYNRECTLLFPH